MCGRSSGAFVLGHRVLRVLQQVVDDLAQLGRVALDQRQSLAQLDLDDGVIVLARVIDAVQVQHLRGERVEVQFL